MKIIDIIDKRTGVSSTSDIHLKILNQGYQLVGLIEIDKYMRFMNEKSIHGIWTSPVVSIDNMQVETVDSIYIFEEDN